MMRQQLEYDPFLYSNGALATVSAGKWTDCSGFAAIQVFEHAAINEGLDAVAVITAWAGNAIDQYAQHIWSGGEGGLTLRSDASANFILVDFVPDDGVHIFEVISGVLTQLGETLALNTPLVYPDVLYAEIQGTTILAKQNEQILGTRETTGALPSGKPGLFFTAGGKCKEWTAGDFQAPSPLLAVGLV